MSENDFRLIVIEGAAKEQFEKSLRDACCGGHIEENEDSIIVHLTKDEFMCKMRLEPDGNELLQLLESGEHSIVERMGLCHGYVENEQVYFDVPGWNNLIAHLRIVNSV